ncbi:MAG: hypothetical protein Q4G24_06970 [Paracoccus sp. (in: a-proteobacteria)]|uniref:hypothetical protein n=1 Tax=Paracoccus sp. TaxID=267 RepID=UPI0026E08BE5|nr:hypothetical protein [Paracoccus sp. (in: a-proteobacteria)]MDO5621195.1 hypothetical protein [Paracoccus sp. (in: a-proteobacteria)]
MTGLIWAAGGAIASLVALLAAWRAGRKAARDEAQARAERDYIITRQRMDDATPDLDDDAVLERLRDRADQR